MLKMTATLRTTTTMMKKKTSRGAKVTNLPAPSVKLEPGQLGKLQLAGFLSILPPSKLTVDPKMAEEVRKGVETGDRRDVTVAHSNARSISARLLSKKNFSKKFFSNKEEITKIMPSVGHWVRNLGRETTASAVNCAEYDKVVEPILLLYVNHKIDRRMFVGKIWECYALPAPAPDSRLKQYTTAWKQLGVNAGAFIPDDLAQFPHDDGTDEELNLTLTETERRRYSPEYTPPASPPAAPEESITTAAGAFWYASPSYQGFSFSGGDSIVLPVVNYSNESDHL